MYLSTHSDLDERISHAHAAAGQEERVEGLSGPSERAGQ
jgi:hypothetical protein